MDVKIISKKQVFQGKVFNVRQDTIILPNHKQATFDIVDHHGAVVILPVDENRNCWFIHQYRHAAGETLLEIPAGTLEDGESPETSAYRETREEIGMAPGKLTKIGEFYITPGYSTEYLYIYLAENLSPDPLPGDIDELIEVEKISVENAYHMVRTGKIRDAKTLAVMLLAQPYLIP